MPSYTTTSGETTQGLVLSGQDSQTVLTGGSAINTVLNGSAGQILDGGRAVGTLIQGGGLYSSAYVSVLNGGMASGTIVQDGRLSVESGGSATDVVLMAARDGSYDNADIYMSGGTLTNAAAYTGSLYTSGGLSLGTKLYGNAQQGIGSTATVSGTVVNSGASQFVSIRPENYRFDDKGQYTNVTGTVVNAGGTLILESGGVSNVTLNAGAIIQYQIADVSGGSYSVGATNILTVSNERYSFSLQLAGDYADKSFTITGNGAHGSTIRLLCFCRDTLIRTPDGDVAVQALRASDRVLTADGRDRAVRWIGSQAGIVGDDHPVLIHAGAFPDGMPLRDLRVTRGHAFVFGQVLIPIGALVNDRTIRWDFEARWIEVFHVELDRHAILLAEGAQAESYRDDGNRLWFRTGGAIEDAGSMATCMPVVASGPIVDRTRRRLAERAASLNRRPSAAANS